MIGYVGVALNAGAPRPAVLLKSSGTVPRLELPALRVVLMDWPGFNAELAGEVADAVAVVRDRVRAADHGGFVAADQLTEETTARRSDAT